MKKFGQSFLQLLFSRLEFLRKPKASKFLLQSIPLWIASCIVGCIAVLYAQILHFGEEVFLLFYKNNRAWVFILAPVFFFLSFISVRYFAKYSNASGIPQVMAALVLPKKKSKIINELLSIRIIIVKIISSFFMSIGGGVVGREGPTIQIAASILHVTNRILPKSWPKISDKLMIII